jgi:ABC-2 type transport system permease protein
MRDWFVVLFPFLTGLVFIVVINISGGYLLQSIVDEKENRTMEVIITSSRPSNSWSARSWGTCAWG